MAGGAQSWDEGSVVRACDGAPYELVRRLGAGVGSAEVWLARFTAGGVCQEVALKCARPDLPKLEGVRALVSEAQLASRLRHENIARLHALGELAGRQCLVLEYVDGESAQELLAKLETKKKSFSREFCCYAVASIAAALEYAHGMTDTDGRPLGIVHRDIKAGNIVVAWNGRVVLLDFGVALSRMEGRDRTKTGVLKGSCAYMSPERIREDQPIDGRSDLFSLGIVLVELLTGKRPFDAKNDYLTEEKIVECAPKDVEAATKELPAELRSICLRALERSPSDRYQTGGELRRALKQYLVHRGAVYEAAECAEELRELELRTASTVAASLASSSKAGAGSSEEKGDYVAAASAVRSARSGAAPRAVARRRWLRVALGLALLGGGLAALRIAPVGRRAWYAQGAGSAAVAVSSGSTPGGEVEGGRCEAEPLMPVAEAVPVTIGPAPTLANMAPWQEPLLVRAKRVNKGARGMELAFRPAGASPGKALELRRVGEKQSAPQERSRPPGARGTGRRERALLKVARHTLIEAKLLRSIDPSEPGIVEAVITRQIEDEGMARVPTGSRMICYSGRGMDSRVEVSCDEIRTENQDFVLEGRAFQGGHLGLRLVDGTVAAGTLFSVVLLGSSSAW